MAHHGGPSQGWKHRAERAEEMLRDAQRRHNALEHVNRDLTAKLEARDEPAGASLKPLEPVGRLADAVKDTDQARTLLAELTERIAEGLQERDALLEYILARCPDAPEKVERERLPQTHRSRIFKLRIGPQDGKRCVACGQPSKESCSAHLFVGTYDDGRLGELFIQLGRDRRSGLAGGGFHMASRMTSLALQHHASIESVIRQWRYHNDSSGGRPYGVEGPLKEPSSVRSLSDYIGWTLEKCEEERKKEASNG